MLKKIICILLLIFVSGCTKKEEIKKPNIIQPMNDVLIMSEINDELKNRLIDVNGKDLNNYQFKSLYKNVYSNDLKDIDGRIVRLTSNDILLLQVMSISCNHCHDLLMEIQNYDHSDYKWIIYFDNGTDEEVKKLLDESEFELPEDVTILSKDKGLSEYVRKELGLEIYPSSIFYKNDVLSFVYGGNYDSVQFAKLKDIGFKHPIEKSEFIVDGEDVIDKAIGILDVEKQISETNRNRIKEFIPDSKYRDVLYSEIGQSVDFSVLNNVHSSIYLNEVEDYGEYQNSDLVILLSDVKEKEDIEFLNALIDEDYEYLCIFNDSFYSSSDKYLDSGIKLSSKCASSLAAIPEFINNIRIDDYPSALYIKDGVIMGLYPNIKDKETYKKAIDLFIVNPIAYVENN